MLLHRRFHDGLRRHIAPQIHHVKTVVFQKDLHNILSDIVNIAFDCGEDHFSLLLLDLTAGLHGIFHDGEGCFRRLRAHQKLRKEHRSCLKAFSHFIESRNHIRVDKIQGVRVL